MCHRRYDLWYCKPKQDYLSFAVSEEIIYQLDVGAPTNMDEVRAILSKLGNKGEKIALISQFASQVWKPDEALESQWFAYKDTQARVMGFDQRVSKEQSRVDLLKFMSYGAKDNPKHPKTLPLMTVLTSAMDSDLMTAEEILEKLYAKERAISGLAVALGGKVVDQGVYKAPVREIREDACEPSSGREWGEPRERLQKLNERSGKAYEGGASRPGAASRDFKAMKCYRCGEMGHISRVCTKKLVFVNDGDHGKDDRDTGGANTTSGVGKGGPKDGGSAKFGLVREQGGEWPKKGSFIVRLSVNGSDEVDAIWDPGADITTVNPARVPNFTRGNVWRYAGQCSYPNGDKVEVDGFSEVAMRIGGVVMNVKAIITSQVQEPVILGNDWYDLFVKDNKKEEEQLVLKDDYQGLVVQMHRANQDRVCGIKKSISFHWKTEETLIIKPKETVKFVVIPNGEGAAGTSLIPDWPRHLNKWAVWNGVSVTEDGLTEISITYNGLEALSYPPGTRMARSYSSSKSSALAKGKAETRGGAKDGDHAAGSF